MNENDVIKDPIKGACCKEARRLIYWNDVYSYWYLCFTNGGVRTGPIRFCPFCGTRLL
jgi:hypothetical protein